MLLVLGRRLANVIPTLLAVIALVKDLVLHHEWISSGTDVSWETWKKNHTETPE